MVVDRFKGRFERVRVAKWATRVEVGRVAPEAPGRGVVVALSGIGIGNWELGTTGTQGHRAQGLVHLVACQRGGGADLDAFHCPLSSQEEE